MAVEYAWPEFPGPIVKKIATLEEARLSEYPGRYRVAAGVFVTVALEADRLTIATPDGEVAELYAEAEDRFFLLVEGASVVFQRDAAGKVSGLRAIVGGRVVDAPRE